MSNLGLKQPLWLLYVCKGLESEHPIHCSIATDLLRHKAYMTDFERRFLIGIMAHAKLSTKQAQTLETIRVKVATACDMS